MIEPTVRTAVASLATGLTAVGLVTVPKDTALPYAVVHRISGTRSATHGGPDGMVVSRIQVDVVGRSYMEAKINAADIYLLQYINMEEGAPTELSSFSLIPYSEGVYSGPMPGKVAKVVLENEIDFDESDVNQHRVTLDFIINHYE